MSTRPFISLQALAALAVWVTCTQSGMAATELYFRPEAGIVGFGNDKYKGTESYGVSGAYRFNDEGQHELGIEWSVSKLEYSDMPARVIYGGSSTHMDGTLHNVLFGYRYHFGKRENRWRPFCGALAGLAIHNTDARDSNDTAFGLWKGTVRSCGAALGGVGGVDFRLNKRTSLQLSLRYLEMPDLGHTKLVQMNGATTRDLELGSLSSAALILAMNFRL